MGGLTLPRRRRAQTNPVKKSDATYPKNPHRQRRIKQSSGRVNTMQNSDYRRPRGTYPSLTLRPPIQGGPYAGVFRLAQVVREDRRAQSIAD